MLKTRKAGLLLAFSPIIVFVLLFFSARLVAGQTDAFSEIQEKLTGVSQEEKTVLEKLFILVQETEEMEREEKEIAREIVRIQEEVQNLTGLIAREEASYENKQDVLKQVLKSYQRRGPGSYLEIMLNSDSLAAFLRRINTMRDLARNTGELMDVMEESREKLAGEKTKLGEKLIGIEEKQLALKETLSKKKQLKEEQEKYLASLQEEGHYYREQLEQIEEEWTELKTLFPELVRGVSQIVEEGDLEGSLPADAVKITFSFSGIKGTIDEKTFNQIISGYTSLPEFVVGFQPGKLEIRLPKRNLVLTGTFAIVEGKILKFEGEEGSFYGLPLKTGAIDELFREGQLVFNLEPLMGGNILYGIEIQEGYLSMEFRRTSY